MIEILIKLLIELFKVLIELRVEIIKLEVIPQQSRRWAQKDCEEGSRGRHSSRRGCPTSSSHDTNPSSKRPRVEPPEVQAVRAEESERGMDLSLDVGGVNLGLDVEGH